MSIRPMDMQVILPQTQSTKAAKEVVVNRNDNTVQQAQMDEKQEMHEKANRVDTFDEKDNPKVKDEDKKQQMAQQKKKKKKEEEKKKKNKIKSIHKNEIDQKEYESFDMKI